MLLASFLFSSLCFYSSGRDKAQKVVFLVSCVGSILLVEKWQVCGVDSVELLAELQAPVALPPGRVQLSAALWTVARQAPVCMGSLQTRKQECGTVDYSLHSHLSPEFQHLRMLGTAPPSNLASPDFLIFPANVFLLQSLMQLMAILQSPQLKLVSQLETSDVSSFLSLSARI